MSHILYPPAFYKRIENEKRLHPELNLGPLQPCEERRVGLILPIPGPPNTPYAGFVYELEVAFDSSYPFSAPYLRFRTPIFHPNIHPSGRMSNLMVEAWSPHKTVATIYESAIQLLSQPLNEYPYNDVAAQLWETDPNQFRIIASQYRHPEEHPQPLHPAEFAPGHTDTDKHP